MSEKPDNTIAGRFVRTAILAAALFALWPDSGALSSDQSGLYNEYYGIRLDQETIARGYTVSGFGALKLSLVPGILDDATPVEIIRLRERIDEPWGLDRLGDLFQFEFKNKAAYQDEKPFYIQLGYDRDDGNYKQVFFYDKNKSAWRPLPSQDYPAEKFVRSRIHLPYARIAVFSHPGVMAGGRASWYAHKAGNYAASPDFPNGSRLRVYRQDKSAFVDVEINDYGPDRSLHPDRVIDLEKNAFAALFPLGAGTGAVLIEPLGAAAMRIDPAAGMGAEPSISAASALVMDDDGQALYQKDAASSRPLASLTKVMAVKVFFDTNPSLSREIAYSVQDERYNYEHVNQWESARLSLADGDIITLEDLVYSSLTGSTNNTVETLVRASGLKRSDFIARMNALAALWGASSTRFIEPSGLAPENVSSARDYGIISRECLKHPLIAKASTAYDRVVTVRNSGRTIRVKNTNSLVRQGKYGLIGSKTGYLDEAGYCLMVKANHAGKDFYVITLGVENRELSIKETEALMNFAKRKLLNSGLTPSI